jgi:hypothetical protein
MKAPSVHHVGRERQLDVDLGTSRVAVSQYHVAHLTWWFPHNNFLDGVPGLEKIRDKIPCTSVIERQPRYWHKHFVGPPVTWCPPRKYTLASMLVSCSAGQFGSDVCANRHRKLAGACSTSSSTSKDVITTLHRPQYDDPLGGYWSIAHHLIPWRGQAKRKDEGKNPDAGLRARKPSAAKNAGGRATLVTRGPERF